MKQSSKYLFHDLVNSLFIFSLNFLSMISNKFSSKNAKVRVAYVGAIFVPIAVPRCLDVISVVKMGSHYLELILFSLFLNL